MNTHGFEEMGTEFPTLKEKKNDKGSTYGAYTTEKYKPCYESHPIISLGEGKGQLYGGRADDPVIEDADIYVSLNHGASSSLQTYPWDTTSKPIVEVSFPIPDMGVPKDIKAFKAMVKWLGNQLQEGKNVHVGCMAGHGRTGLLLAALLATVTQKKKAIHWLRKHYCNKAVESQHQVDFLVKHFGVAPMPASKPVYKGSQGNLGFYGGVAPLPIGKRSIFPISGIKSIWKDPASLDKTKHF